jgi:sphingomyelin phosphodiesterase
VAKNSPLSSSELCSAFLNCSPIKNPYFDWNVTFPNVPKPPVVENHPPAEDAPKLRILHLSDLHVDFEYQPGSIANCGQPLCCRNSSTLKANKIGTRMHSSQTNEPPAGYWGDYRNCDIPIWTLENMFEYISKNEQVNKS